MYGLGVNTPQAWEKLEAETGALENRPLNRGAYKIDREKSLEYWYKICTVQIRKPRTPLIAAIPESEAQKGFWALRVKKHNIERDERKREEFIAEIEALPEDSELYYSDESGFDEYYSQKSGYALRGEKV
ncbi:MAG: hypothetical protein LBL35_09255 [Clostridiales bacterium]|jgi:hypothetical protein|nr:hypothetical protein [Clostridiales bacterium]